MSTVELLPSSVQGEAMEPLSQIDTTLWCAEGQQPMGPGTRMPVRSAIIKLESGGLWIHSPLKFSVEALEAIRSLGEVKTLTAPSGFHHLHVARTQQHFSQAEIWASPAVAPKQPKLKEVHWLGQDPPPEWAEEIEPCASGACPRCRSGCFFIAPARPSS